jgi:HRAS-like suppressor 3
LENIVPDSLPLGAHVTTPRRAYSHHGIYVGDGHVIHYAGFGRLFRRGPVEEISLDQFACGRGFAIKQWVAPRFSGAARVERARSRLGESRYRLWSNNCEHFCQWCISGTSRSPQVEVWTSRLNRWFGAFGFSVAFQSKSVPFI